MRFDLERSKRDLELYERAGETNVSRSWCAAALAEIERLHRLFYELVPWGGSEFAGNLDKCVKRVRDEIGEYLRLTAEARAEANTLRAENERLCTELTAKRERAEAMEPFRAYVAAKIERWTCRGKDGITCSGCGGMWRPGETEEHDAPDCIVGKARALAPAQEAKP